MFCVSQPAIAQQGVQQFEKFNLQGVNDTGAKSWDVKGDTAQIEGNTIYINKIAEQSTLPIKRHFINHLIHSGQLGLMRGSVITTLY